MPRRRFYVLVTAVMALVLGGASYAVADDGGKGKRIKTDRLTGFEETPSVYSNGQGSFKAQLTPSGDSVAFELRWSGFTATMAHLHFAQRGVAGGIVVHFCGTGGKPPCPANGLVEGTFGPSDVTAANGLDTFDELLKAIKAKRIYVNVHSAAFQSGEIRAQLEVSKRGRDGDDD